MLPDNMKPKKVIIYILHIQTPQQRKSNRKSATEIEMQVLGLTNGH